MSNQSFYLFQLQKIDHRADQIQARMNQIQSLIGDQKALTDADLSYQTALSALQELQNNLALLEKKSIEKRLKMEISESSLYGGKIKNPKELTDLQQEIASLKASLTQLENEQLELMLQIEEQQQTVNTSKEVLEATISRQETSHHQWIEENQKLVIEVDRSRLERDAIVQQLKPESISLYDSLRKTKKGLAVAGVEDQCCTICGSQLTPAEVQQAKSSLQILLCPSCGRILYAD